MLHWSFSMQWILTNYSFSSFRLLEHFMWDYGFSIQLIPQRFCVNLYIYICIFTLAKWCFMICEMWMISRSLQWFVSMFLTHEQLVHGALNACQISVSGFLRKSWRNAFPYFFRLYHTEVGKRYSLISTIEETDIDSLRWLLSKEWRMFALMLRVFFAF